MGELVPSSALGPCVPYSRLVVVCLRRAVGIEGKHRTRSPGGWGVGRAVPLAPRQSAARGGPLVPPAPVAVCVLRVVTTDMCARGALESREPAVGSSIQSGVRGVQRVCPHGLLQMSVVCVCARFCVLCETPALEE